MDSNQAKGLEMLHHGEQKVGMSFSVLRERLALWMWKHGWVSLPL